MLALRLKSGWGINLTDRWGEPLGSFRVKIISGTRVQVTLNMRLGISVLRDELHKADLASGKIITYTKIQEQMGGYLALTRTVNEGVVLRWKTDLLTCVVWVEIAKITKNIFLHLTCPSYVKLVVDREPHEEGNPDSEVGQRGRGNDNSLTLESATHPNKVEA